MSNANELSLQACRTVHCFYEMGLGDAKMIWADVKVGLDADAPSALATGEKIILRLGEELISCRLMLGDRKALLPGESVEVPCVFDNDFEARPGSTYNLVSVSTAEEIGSCTILRMHLPRSGLGEKQQVKARLIEERLLTHPYQPVLWSLIAKELFFFNPAEGEELRQYLLDNGVIVSVDEDLYFHTEALKSAQKLICEYLEKNESITSGQARDLLGSSRKFIIPLLEYFDSQGITVRKGNQRILGV